MKSRVSISERGKKGKDAFGPFRVTGGPCECCGQKEPNMCVQWFGRHFKLPGGIQVERTILKRTNTYIGIICGCYARFHRQIAHIEDNMKRRKK